MTRSHIAIAVAFYIVEDDKFIEQSFDIRRLDSGAGIIDVDDKIPVLGM